MALGTEVGDAFITIHGDTSRFRADLARLNRVLGTSIKRNRDFASSLSAVNQQLKNHDRVMGRTSRGMRRLGNETANTSRKVKSSQSIFEKFSDSVSDRWRRMDSTVRLVLSLILAAGPQMATLGSVMSSSLTAVAAAAAGAVLALAPLLGLLPPLVAGFGLLFTNLDAMKNAFTQFGDALKRQAAGAFDVFNERLEALLDTILKVLDPAAIKAVVGVFTTALDNLNKVLSGDVGQAFHDALVGPLSAALDTIVAALTGPLFSAFLNFVTATAPVALQLAEMFYTWADGLNKFFEEGRKSGALQAFFESLLPTLQAVLDLFGATKDVLITVFKAAVGPGTEFLNIIVGLLGQWNDWMNSISGQQALQEWFDNLFAVLPSLMELLGAAGTAIADLVTPKAVDATKALLGGLADIMPLLSDILALLSEAGIIDLLVSGLKALGEIIDPLIEPLGELLSALSSGIIDALSEAGPYLTELGEFLGEILRQVTPLIPAIIDFATSMFRELWPAFEALMPAIIDLVEALAPMVVQIVNDLLPAMQPLIDLFLKWIEALIPLIDPLVALISEGAVPLEAILALLTPILEQMLENFDKMHEAIKPLIDLFSEIAQEMTGNHDATVNLIAIFGTLGEIVAFIMGAIIDVWSKWINLFVGAVKLFKGVRDSFGEYFKDIGRYFSEVFDKIKKFFDSPSWSGLADIISTPFKYAFNAIAKLWNNTVGKLSFKVPDWVPGMGGKGWDVPDIPTFARGAVLDRPTFGMFAEAGREALVPLDRPLSQVDPSVRWLSAIAQGKMGASNTSNATININTPATDPRLIASILEDNLFSNWR